MNRQRKNTVSALWALPLAALLPLPVFAQLIITDTLTGTSSSYPWVSQNGACLTAGDNTGTIPACTSIPHYSGTTLVGGVSGRLPDPVGKGALRLTNGDTTQNGGNGNSYKGSIVSNFIFPTSQGVQVTFSTATYGGNGFGNSSGANSGADGIVFFLSDGGPTTRTSSTITRSLSPGGVGGSLGYSCSNVNSAVNADGSMNTSPDGVDGAYLGVGIDEYGNFTNQGDNTATGSGAKPNTVSIRGAGSIAYAALYRDYPTYFPSGGYPDAASQIQVVKDTCSTGLLKDYSPGTFTPAPSNGKKNNNGGGTYTFKPSITVLDYPAIGAPVTLTTPIYSQEAVNMPMRGSSATNIFNYNLSITQDGLLSLSYNVNGGAASSIISKQSITAGNGPLPENFRFGFSSGTGGGSNVHEILCFKAAQLNTATDSAGTNVQQSAKVQAGSQVYLAYYHPLNSWGQLTASGLVADSAGNVTINSTANWDANCVLTGGVCNATGIPTVAQSPLTRSIVSWNGTSGVPFEYPVLTGNTLSLQQQTALGSTTADITTRVAYLRGDRTNEINTSGSGTYRRRDGVLGDIRNSSPTWVGFPSQNYSSAGIDKLSNTAVSEFGTSYASFVSNNATRANVVYAGANDGMMHGFRAGAYDSTTQNYTTTPTPNDGMEVLSYMPGAVVSSIHATTGTSAAALDFSSPQYAHNEYVDATPGTGDLYYANAWHSWLVGGLGAGGNTSGAINDNTTTAKGVLYALDITDPSKFSEGNASTLVKGEWDSSSITCLNDATCKTKLGSVFGTPIVRRMHDGNWAVIFGNGRNSANGTAGIFIMTVDRASGAQTFRYLDTGVGSATAKNGIDYVASADLDGDHVIDYLYAGDLSGNVWRFDVTSGTALNWKADTTPMFTTATGQPITTRIAVNAITQSAGPSRLVLALGTGEQLPQTATSPATFATGQQSLYGVWDSKLTAWNALGSTQFAALPTSSTIALTSLQAQSITTSASASGTISGYRTVTQKAVCWSGSSVCSGGTAANTQFGWKIDLPASTEQIIYNPIVAYGTFLINTTIPSTTQTLSCTTQPASGFTMALSPETGGALSNSFFDTAATSAGFPASNSANGFISGLGLSATGSPSIVTAAGKPFLVQQTTSGSGVVTKVDPITGKSGRLTWIKLR